MSYIVIPTVILNAGYGLFYGDGLGGWIEWVGAKAKQLNTDIPLRITSKNGEVLKVVDVIRNSATTVLGVFNYNPSDMGLVGFWDSAGVTGNISFVITNVPSYDDTPPPEPDFVVTQELLNLQNSDVNLYVNSIFNPTLNREFDFPVTIDFVLLNGNEFLTYPDGFTLVSDIKISRTYNEPVNVGLISFTYDVPVVIPTYTVPSDLKYNLSQKFCDGLIDGNEIVTGDVYDYPLTLTVTPKSTDYEFLDGTRLKSFVYESGLIVVNDLDLEQREIVIVPPTPVYKIEQSFLDTLFPVGATVTINDITPYLNMELFGGEVVKVVADMGRRFFIVPNSLDSVNIRTPLPERVSFDLSEDLKTATWEFYLALDPLGIPRTGYVLYVSTVADIVDDVANVNDVWLLDPELLPLITQYNFKGSDGITTESYSGYFIGLIQLPFKINPDLIAEQKNIYLGDLDTGILSDSLLVDSLNIDMGEINVTGSGNFTDYKNVNIVLHLPYSKSVFISPEYVINETIKIEYVVNLYNGDLMINIWSSKINAVIITENVNMNVSVPFGGVDTFPRNNDPRDVTLGGDNGIYTPFIEFMKSDVILSDGFYTIPITDEKVLSDETGYIRVENIDIVSKANSYEKELITQQLQSGVIIK